MINSRKAIGLGLAWLSGYLVGNHFEQAEPEPEKPKKEEWKPHWVGARYRLGENGQDGCYVIFVDKDTNQCDCNDMHTENEFCCRLADSLECNGNPPPKKKKQWQEQ